MSSVFFIIAPTKINRVFIVECSNMKKWILFVGLLIPLVSCGQHRKDLEEPIASLVQDSLISKELGEKLKWEVLDKKVREKQGLIWSLRRHIMSEAGIEVDDYSVPDRNHILEEADYNEIERTIEGLHKSTLASDICRQEMLSLLDHQRHPIFKHYISRLASPLDVYTYLWERESMQWLMYSKEFAQYFQRLINNELIYPEQYEALKAHILEKETYHPLAIVPFFIKGILVEKDKLPTEPQAMYEEACRQVAQLVDISLNNFEVNFFEKQEKGADWFYWMANISFEVEGTAYSYNASYFPNDEEKPFSLGRDFYWGINQVLVDQQSLYRIESFGEDPTMPSFGVIAFTESQKNILDIEWEKARRELQAHPSVQTRYFKFHWFILESYPTTTFDLISSKKRDSAIDYMQSMGFMDSLNESQQDSLLAEFRLYPSDNVQWMFNRIPNLMTEIEWETWGGEKFPYKERIQAFTQNTRLSFTPTHIIDEYHKAKPHKKFTVGFTLNGKKYKTQLEKSPDWIDKGFLDLINQALESQGFEGKFYPIEAPYEYTTQNIYLTPQEFQSLHEKDYLIFLE